jgi:hypothetical protein
MGYFLYLKWNVALPHSQTNSVWLTTITLSVYIGWSAPGYSFIFLVIKG